MKIRSLLVAICCLGFSVSSVAAPDPEMPELVALVKEIKSYLGKMALFNGQDITGPAKKPQTPDLKDIDTAVQSYLNLRQVQPDLEKSEAKSGSPLVNMQQFTDDLTQQQIKNVLTTIDDPGCGDGSSKCLSVDSVANTFISMGVTNIYTDLAQAKAVNPADSILNINSLLGPLSYAESATTYGAGVSQGSSTPPAQQNTKKLYAQLFIRYVSGLADPVRLLSVNNYKNLSPENQRDYILRLETFSSLVSVGMSNLFNMYVERVPVGTNKPSLAQAEATMVARRMTPQWRAQMEKAEPLTIQRENLYLLAEMNYQLYRSRQQQERILATLSTLQLQNLQVMIKTGVSPSSELQQKSVPAPGGGKVPKIPGLSEK